MSEQNTEQTGKVVARPTEQFGRYVQERAQIEAGIVAKELGADQMDAILNATTEAELSAAMEMSGLIGLRNMEDGTELQVNSFHYAPGNRSEFANRFGVFAVLECTMLATGENIALDTGVERIIVWLRAQELLGGFPVQRRVSKIQTGNGEMITLLPLRPRAVKGETA